MPQGQPRQLSEPEFNAIRDRLLDAAPEGLSEQDFHRWIGPRMEQALGEAENTAPALEGSAAGRFASGLGEMLNPVEAVKGLYSVLPIPQMLGGSGIIEGPGKLVGAQVEQFRKAANAPSISEAIGHGAAGLIPILGPMAANIGEQIGDTGDIAGGVGRTAGLIAGPKIVEGAVRGARAVPGIARQIPGALPTRIAENMERGAAERVADVMSPKVGPNKMRFGTMAQEVAPTIAKDPAMASLSRQALHEKVSTRLEEAESALDAAADARLKALSFETQPLIKDLMDQRRTLSGQPLEASSPIPSIGNVAPPTPPPPRPTPKWGEPSFTEESFTTPSLEGPRIPPPPTPPPEQFKTARPFGRGDVDFKPNLNQLAAIDDAIAELKTLGPRATYEDLRKMRMAYDKPAKIKYSPSMTADYLKQSGYSSGAANVTGTLREHLAKFDPETAAANTPYSLWRKANDVLEATAEVERTRPKVGRAIAARVAGTFLGGTAGGGWGAAAGFFGGPFIEEAMSRGATYKLPLARGMSRLAAEIRKGNLEGVNSILNQLQRPSPPPGLIPIARTPIPSMKP